MSHKNGPKFCRLFEMNEIPSENSRRVSKYLPPIDFPLSYLELIVMVFSRVVSTSRLERNGP